MTLLLLNTCLIISLLFAIKYVRDFFKNYEGFRKLKKDLTDLTHHVEAIIQKAENTNRVFQEQIQFASQNIIPQMPKAHVAKEDLLFLVDHGNQIADRLESLTREAKRTFLGPNNTIFSSNVMRDKDNVVPIKENDPFCVHTIIHDDGSTIERRGLYTTIKRAR